MSQRERIMDFMKKNGSITPMDAFAELGITKLATRISEMRADGIEINGVMEKSKNRFGEPTHYTRYSLGRRGN